MVDGSECTDEFNEQEHHYARYTTSRNAFNFQLLVQHPAFYYSLMVSASVFTVHLLMILVGLIL
jgi:hypothetical protein